MLSLTALGFRQFRRGPTGIHGHHGCMRFCLDRESNVESRTSHHAPLRQVRSLRLAVCNEDPPCLPSAPPLSVRPPGPHIRLAAANVPDEAPQGPIIDRETTGASDIRWLAQCYIWSEGRRPGWNSNAFVRVPDVNVWHAWHHHAGSRHIR